MKKLLIAALCLCAFARNISAQIPAETPAQKDARMKWWKDARFGLFIHWGLYSVPAGEWNGQTNHGEWIRTTAQIPIGTYDKFVQQFNPVKFNANDWVQMAKNAGMKYIVITSKHHDGFALFDSEVSDFDVMATPFKRDILKELADACKKEGIQLCFYHSIMDWHHPDYLPRREWEKDRTTAGARFSEYQLYMEKQLKELLTKYGKIGILWFDGEWENTWTHEKGKQLYTHVRELQPSIIVNNRVDVGRSGMAGLTKDGDFVGDYGTPEQEIPATGIPGVYWESCMTMNNNWGYNSHDNDFKSSTELIRNLIDIASKGGNFLLNVGPTAEGLFPQKSIDRLKDMGDWMSIGSQSIYGTEASPFKNIPWGRCTQKATATGTSLYFNIFDWTDDKRFVIPGLGNEVIACYTLAGKRKLKYERRGNDYVVDLFEITPLKHSTTFVVEIKGKPIVYDAPVITASSSIFTDKLAVSIITKIPGAVIRYTTNGDEPTEKSPVANKTIELKQTATVKAKVFLNGQAVSGSSESRYEKVTPLPSVEVSNTQPGLNYSIYEGEWSKLPDFSSLKAVTTGSVKQVDISAKQGSEKYAYVFDGFITVPATGVYTFYLSSDDGSQLFIDKKLQVDNDGLHGIIEKSKEVPMAKGTHAIRITFFEHGGGDDLKVFWSGPGIKVSEIPASVLKRN